MAKTLPFSRKLTRQMHTPAYPQAPDLQLGVEQTLRKLRLQRVVGFLFFVPFSLLFVLGMRLWGRYRIPNIRELRKQFREMMKDDSPLLICANHLTYIDSALILWALAPVWWYAFHYHKFSWNLPAGDHFKKKRIHRWVAFLSKCIFIHRDGDKNHKTAILNTVRYLADHGHIITLFPEGRRSRSGRFDTQNLTYGIGKIIHHLENARVLCVYLRGHKQETYSPYPAKGSRFHIAMELIRPHSTKEGREAYAECTDQIVTKIREFEDYYFAREKPWALVTGASSGIGRALAFRFAKEGYHLVLVARSADRLSEIADDCLEQFGTMTKIIVKNLSLPSACAEIFEEINQSRILIDTLINNAGFGIHGAYVETEISKEIDMINLHITSLLQLTKLFLPGMMERNRGRILNVASVYSYSSVPMQSVYSATKSFMLTFSGAIRNEIQNCGVSVTVLCPGVTRTEFRQRMGIEKNRDKGMDPHKVAAIAFRAVMKRKFIAIPGLTNRLYVWIACNTPRALMANVIRRINMVRGLQH